MLAIRSWIRQMGGARRPGSAAVDGDARHHAPTIGLLLCATRNERTMRYALARSTSPMPSSATATANSQPHSKALVPAEAALVDAVSGALDGLDPAPEESPAKR